MPKPIMFLVAAGCLSLAWTQADPAAAGEPQGLSLTAARAMDSDKDGQISEAEFFARSDDGEFRAEFRAESWAELWKKLDANADGVLDAEEQKQGIQVQPITVN